MSENEVKVSEGVAEKVDPEAEEEAKEKPITIATRIVRLSKEKGITQTEIAKSIGKGFTSVNNWFRNQDINIPAYAIYPIAQLFGVSCEFLLTGKDPDPMPPASAEKEGRTNSIVSIPDITKSKDPELTEQEKGCLELFRSLDLRGQTMMLHEGYRYQEKAAEAPKQEEIA